ncbi:hypothetical protein FKW77_003612 [Venturia effusa]|uniref:Major facilitator superfamily (MFS) profile domain-containing protein n=1 Tax=Venturia effusa TaxID=50376 RepID=A0A517LMK4_9PEZI|nr:hypothetical protein FKW77_003612 [Venturia effusa]
MATILFTPFQYLYRLTGLSSVVATGWDAWLIILTRTSRMFAYGFNALIMALFFEEMGYADDLMGLFFTLTLLGDVLLSLLLTLVADGLGRRKVLFGGSALMVLSGAAFALSENYWVLLFAAVVGVISPSGGEIGPFRAIEESTLSHLTVPDTRAEVLTWYIVTATVGTSAGLVFCGNLVDRLQEKGWTAKEAYHTLFWIYSACGVANMLLTLFLSSKCEAESHSSNQEQKYKSVPQAEPSSSRSPSPRTHARTPSSTPLMDSDGRPSPPPAAPAIHSKPPPAPKPKSGGIASKFAQISPESRPILYKLTAIMSLDSLSSGMSAQSLLSLYITRRFSIPKGYLGSILSVSSFIAAFMNIWSGAIAKRIGLIKTMVFTHLPSAIFLALLPVPRKLWGTVALLFARSCLSSLDQAPRTAFIAAVVKPGERTAVMGIVNVLKILAQSGGPSVTGLLAGHRLFWLAFVLAGSFKVCYDIGLLTLFVGTKLHKYEGNQENAQPARDEEEEDLSGLVDDSDDDDSGDESETGEGGKKYEAIRSPVKSQKRPRKSFSLPSMKQPRDRQGSDESLEGDLASPRGHRRQDSFPLKRSDGQLRK